MRQPSPQTTRAIITTAPPVHQRTCLLRTILCGGDEVFSAPELSAMLPYCRRYLPSARNIYEWLFQISWELVGPIWLKLARCYLTLSTCRFEGARLQPRRLPILTPGFSPWGEIEFCRCGSEVPQRLKPVAFDGSAARLKARPFKAPSTPLRAGYAEGGTLGRLVL
jgi:hypothetical protein